MTILRKFDKKFRLTKKKKKKKKKRINNDDTFIDTNSRIADNCFFNGDEKEVAKILQQLPQFILGSEFSAHPFLFITWGVKKRRSLTNESQSPSPPLSCNFTRNISSGKSFIPSNSLLFSSLDSFSKQSTCKRNTSCKTKMKMKKSIDALTRSSRNQENKRKLMMGDCNNQKFRNLELKSNPSSLQQRDKLYSNFSRKRRSFDLSSAGATVFYPVPEEEEEEEGEEKGSLTKVADQSRFESEMNEKSYSQIAESVCGEVGVVMAKHLSPDLKLGPEEKFLKSFNMNKQTPLQMC